MKRRKISIDNPEHSMNQYLSQNLATMQDTPGPYGGFLAFIEPGRKFITKQIRKLCKEESHPPQD